MNHVYASTKWTTLCRSRRLNKRVLVCYSRLSGSRGTCLMTQRPMSACVPETQKHQPADRTAAPSTVPTAKPVVRPKVEAKPEAKPELDLPATRVSCSSGKCCAVEARDRVCTYENLYFHDKQFWALGVEGTGEGPRVARSANRLCRKSAYPWQTLSFSRRTF